MQPIQQEEATLITLNIKTLLDEKNGGNISEFMRGVGISYTTALDLYHSRGKGITYEMMNKLCNYFGVGPGELFNYKPDRKPKE